MHGPSFEKLYDLGEKFRCQYKLPRFSQAVNIWHDCVGHSLFVQFTPPTLEGELLTGRHQHLVACGNIQEVLRAAPAKFDIHLSKIGRSDDPEAVSRKEKVLETLEDYLNTLPIFENLSDYDDPFFRFLQRIKKLP